jgi:hypothetical protein
MISLGFALRGYPLQITELSGLSLPSFFGLWRLVCPLCASPCDPFDESEILLMELWRLETPD